MMQFVKQVGEPNEAFTAYVTQGIRCRQYGQRRRPLLRPQAAEFTYKFANNLPESHPFVARAREMAAAIKTRQWASICRFSPTTSCSEPTCKPVRSGDRIFTLSA